MDKKPKKPSLADSPTGVMNRTDLDRDRRRRAGEPPQPPTLPEFEADDAITGAYNIDAEGLDRGKDADDSPNKSALTG